MTEQEQMLERQREALTDLQEQNRKLLILVKRCYPDYPYKGSGLCQIHKEEPGPEDCPYCWVVWPAAVSGMLQKQHEMKQFYGECIMFLYGLCKEIPLQEADIQSMQIVEHLLGVKKIPNEPAKSQLILPD